MVEASRATLNKRVFAYYSLGKFFFPPEKLLLCIKFKGQSKGKWGNTRRSGCVPRHLKGPEVSCVEKGQRLMPKFMHGGHGA